MLYTKARGGIFSPTSLFLITKLVDPNRPMFLRSFKKNWKEGLIIWIILLPILLILILDHRFFSAVFINNSILRFVLRGVTDALILLWFFVFLYVWPLLSRFENTWQKTMVHALLMSIRHLPFTIGMLVLDAGAIVLVYFLIRFMPIFVPVFFILGFPLLAWMNSVFFRKIFVQYEKKKKENTP